MGVWPMAAGKLRAGVSTWQQPRGQGGGGGWVQPLKCHLPLVWSLFPYCSFEMDAQVVHLLFGEVKIL